MVRQQYNLNAAALMAFTGYAVILLHPLWFYNGTHVAGYDYFNYNWNFWWIRHALENGLMVYQNDFVMFPAMSNYGYHALTAFWYPVWALLEPLFGTLSAVNVMIALACVLNGFVLFVWLRSEKVHPGLALLGGVVLQTLPVTRYWYYNTHLNLMDWFWIPGLLLLWKQIYQVCMSKDVGIRQLLRILGWGALFGLGLWGLLLTDLQFPIFAAFLIVPYGLSTLWSSMRIAQTAGGRLVTGKLLFSGITSVMIGLFLMWFAGPLPSIATFTGGLVPGPVEDRPGIPLPAGWFGMADEWWKWDQPSVGWFITCSFLLSAAFLIIFTLRPLWLPVRGAPGKRLRSAWFWLLVAMPPFALALGPLLQFGESSVSMPFVLLYDFTGGNFRMPWRLAPAGVIAATTFIGLVWTPILNEWKVRRKAFQWLFPLLGAVVLILSHTAIRLFESAPLEPILPSYHIYTQMRDDRDPYVVLDVPTGMGTGEVLLGNPRAIQYQWYGIFHEKRMINGFISRAPIEHFYYVDTDDPLLSWLGQRRLLDPVAVRNALRERIFEYPIGFIVLHTDEIARQSATATEEILGFFNGLDDLLCPPRVEGAAVFYRTLWHPEGCENRIPREISANQYEIDIGTPEDQRHIGWGWHYAEPVGGINWRWMGGTPQLANATQLSSEAAATTTLYLTLPPGEYRLHLTGQSYMQARQVRIEVNGLRLSDAVEFVPDELREQVSVPFTVSEDTPLIVNLRPDGILSPNAALNGGDSRQLSVAIDRIRFERIGAP